ncbi:MAG: HD domain-containing protein [Treponema sp.]|nr:HD domain-containing protein [Treponema sp.]
MTSFKVAELTDGRRFPGNVVLDKHFVLLDSNISFSNALKKHLVEWNFKEIFCDVDPERLKPKAAPVVQKFETVDIDLDELNNQYSEKEKTANQILKEAIEKINLNIKNFPDKNRMENVTSGYNEFLNYIQEVFTRYVTHKELQIGSLSEAATLLIDFIKDNKKYLLKIQPSAEHKLDKNFLTSHCLRVAIYSLVIAIQIKMPHEKMVELGVAAMIHEIGQIKLPPQLYLTDKPLSAQARNLLATHTVLGYKILEEAGFPLPIKVGVFEHHERENGQGYPRHLLGAKITAYGKILAVACSYEAITSPRTYKEARSLYEATIEMLTNKNKMYDDIVLRALVQAVSLFPIGTYVYLANGKIGQVSESNPADPRLPIVELVNEKNELGNPKTVMTDNEKNKIVRVLNKEELKGVMAYIK